MSPELAGKIIISSIVAGTFALGRFLYVKYFKAPVRDFIQEQDELGEDNPAVEALLAMRERHASDGNHTKALEYSSKALERCPTNARIKALNDLDKQNALS